MNLRDYVKDGFVANMLRGVHSSGMFAIPEKHEVQVPVVKRSYNGMEFLGVHDTKELLNAYADMRGYVAHLRWATKGNVHRDNAHPFQHGPITMVHNGTLSNEKELGDWKFDTDSEYIAKSLAERPDPRDTIKLLDGAFALVWHDARTDKMYMTRNKDRELGYAYVKGKNAFMFASEWPMMQWLAWRNYIELEEIEDVTPYDILEFPVDDPRSRVIIKAEAYVAPKWNYSQRSASPTGGAGNTIPFTRKVLPTVIMMGSGGNGEVPKGVPENLHPGKEIEFSAMEVFLKDRTSRMGTLEGVMADKPHWRVVARQVDIRKFSGLNRMIGKVIGYICLESHWPTVYVGDAKESKTPDVDKNGKHLGYNRHYRKYKENEQNPILLGMATKKYGEQVPIIEGAATRLAPFLDEERDPDAVLAEVQSKNVPITDLQWFRTVNVDGHRMSVEAAHNLLKTQCAWCSGHFKDLKDIRYVGDSTICFSNCGDAIPFLKHGTTEH
jgi:hypothetical protein